MSKFTYIIITTKRIGLLVLTLGVLGLLTIGAAKAWNTTLSTSPLSKKAQILIRAQYEVARSEATKLRALADDANTRAEAAEVNADQLSIAVRMADCQLVFSIINDNGAPSVEEEKRLEQRRVECTASFTPPALN